MNDLTARLAELVREAATMLDQCHGGEPFGNGELDDAVERFRAVVAEFDAQRAQGERGRWVAHVDRMPSISGPYLVAGQGSVGVAHARGREDGRMHWGETEFQGTHWWNGKLPAPPVAARDGVTG